MPRQAQVPRQATDKAGQSVWRSWCSPCLKTESRWDRWLAVSDSPHRCPPYQRRPTAGCPEGSAIIELSTADDDGKSKHYAAIVFDSRGAAAKSQDDSQFAPFPHARLRSGSVTWCASRAERTVPFPHTL